MGIDYHTSHPIVCYYRSILTSRRWRSSIRFLAWPARRKKSPADRLQRPLLHSADAVGETGDDTQDPEQQAALAHARLCEKAGVAPWAFELPTPPSPAMAPETLLTLRLLITGTVQGVGFRQWLADELTQREIPGWVRNLADGGVEAVIHGSLEHLQPLCDAVASGPEQADVTGLNVTQWEGEPPAGVAILDTH